MLNDHQETLNDKGTQNSLKKMLQDNKATRNDHKEITETQNDKKETPKN